METAAGLLEPREREIVLGDLAEGSHSLRSGLGDVLGLAIRRHAELWASWRPWAVSVTVAWPASLFLMGCSVAATGALAQVGRGMPFRVAIAQFALLAAWSWITGFAVSAISRKTLWASALACCLPCCFCISLWPGSHAGALRLMVFLAPALCGVWQGRRRRSIHFGWAIAGVIAAMLIPLMWVEGGGFYGVGVFLPAVYLLVTARRGWAPA